MEKKKGAETHNTMKKITIIEQHKSTLLFIVFLLAAGICNLLTRSGSAFLDTLMFSANFTIYAGLLLFWIHSVQARLLPTKARSYILSSAILMLLFLMIRIFKYRIVIQNVPLMRYADYLYWLPFLLIPALFLMTAICIQRGKNGDERLSEKWILIRTAL